MRDVGLREVCAGKACTGFHEWGEVSFIFCIGHFEISFWRKSYAVSAESGGENAIKHIKSILYRM